MKAWPKHPVIYEINTWVWLEELERKHGRPVSLGSVPQEEWEAVAACGADAVWFMGVWERSPAGIAISLQNKGLLDDFVRALPDFKAADNVGSPYCVRRYEVDQRLGGPAGLATARQALARLGMRLILDFVPNHVAPDHPWTGAHPEYFVRGEAADVQSDPASFLEADGKVFACGRDPFFPAWPDVLQLNAFDPGLRLAARETVLDIAGQCDGVRCDMAMLMLSDVFERTWGQRAGARPDEDYWRALIPAVKAAWPDFRFLAEAYWDLEWELQRQGFDACYDKRLYDRMEHEGAEGVRGHLLADLAYQQGMVRFIENHDEPRAAQAFPGDKGRAAAVAIMTLPGFRLLHEGQFEGRRTRLPVFLARRPEEPIDQELADFYGRLLRETSRDAFRSGSWRLCEGSGWADNQSCRNMLAWCWEKDGARFVTVVNFSGERSQARIHLPWEDLRGGRWRLNDLLAGESFDRSGDEMLDGGLFVDLGPWRFHLFEVLPG